MDNGPSVSEVTLNSDYNEAAFNKKLAIMKENQIYPIHL